MSISQKLGLRRLHKLGACYRRPNRDYGNDRYLGVRMPESDQYDSFCRSCWRSGQPGGVKTGIRDTEENSSVASSDESSSTMEGS